MNKATLLLALIALAACSLAAGLWFARPPDPTLQLAILETKLREAEATIARLIKERSITTKTLPVHTAKSEIADTVTGPAGEATGGKAGKTAATPGTPAALAAALSAGTQAPTLKTDKRMAEAEAHYSDLINQFGLQPDEKEAFKTLAAKRSDVHNDVISKLMDPSLTPAQRQAILAKGQAELDQADASIREFLNNDSDFETFQKWESQDIERKQIDSGRAIFQNSGAPLDAGQESWLVDSLYALRKNNPGLGDPYSAQTFAGRTIDRNFVNGSLSKFDTDTNVLLQNARSQLSPAQIESLRALRVQQRVQMETQLWNLSRTSGTAGKQ